MQINFNLNNHVTELRKYLAWILIRKGNKKKYSYPCNRPWRPTGLWDVNAQTFSRQSALRWWKGCQPYMLGALYSQEDSWCSFLLEAASPQGHSAAGRIRSTEKSNDLIRNLTHDLQACSTVSQPTTLPRVPSGKVLSELNRYTFQMSHLQIWIPYWLLFI
jgi:hypothetical protein